MEDTSIITGQNEEEIWHQIQADLQVQPEILRYNVLIKQNEQTVLLDIDIDLGGGFESGYATTIFAAPFYNPEGFRFAVHHEDFLDEIGKFFGMQDIKTGYPEFDSKVILKSNNEGRVKELFEDADSRRVFGQLDDYTFEIEKEAIEGNPNQSQLKLFIEQGITDVETLRQLYHAFFLVLQRLDKKPEIL